jgi:WD40 repeat protein
LLSTYGKSQLVDLKSGFLIDLDFSEGTTFSPGDRWLLNVKTGQVKLWDLPNRRSVELSAMGTSECAAFSPRGDRLLVGYQQSMARLWDPKNRRPLFIPLIHSTAIKSVVFSHDGRMVATGSSDNQARVWDAATATALTPPLFHSTRSGAIMDVEFSPDGHRLLSVSNDHTSKIWNLSPDDRSVDELEALAQFLAARRVDESGGVVPLNQADLPRLYERLRQRSLSKERRAP